MRTIAFFKRICFLMVFISPWCEALPAAETPEPDTSLFELPFEELMEIQILSSTRREESLFSVPSAVTVFTGPEIRRMGMSNIESMMNFVPGYQSYSPGETGSTITFSSRGRRLGISSREVLLLMDGQRLNTDWAGGSELYNTLLATENIDRIEFIRGPGSALYGSNAFLGVINIITARDRREAELAAGSYEARQGHVNWFWEKGDLKVSAFAKGFSDHGEKYSDACDTIYGGRSGTRDPRRGEDLYFSLSFRGWRMNLRHSDRRGEDYYITGLLSNKYNRYRQRQSFANLSYAWNWTENISSRLMLSYLYSEVAYTGQVTEDGALLFLSFPPSMEPLYGKAPIEESEPALFFHNSIKLEHGQNLQFGFEYRRPRILDTAPAYNYNFRDIAQMRLPVRHFSKPKATVKLGEHSARRIWGLYAQYQFSFREKLTITSGLRYDHYSDFGHATSLRVGAVYCFSKQTSFKLLYGEAFRAPARNETNFQGNPFWKGNPDLDPEESKTWELIWVQQFSRGNLSLTWFHCRIKNSIFLEEDESSSQVLTYFNSGEERSEGFELEAAAELTDCLSLRASLTHLCHKPESGFREAKDMASLVFNYHRGKWNINLSGYYHGERRVLTGDSKRKTLSDYGVISCKIQYELVPGLSAFVQVDNLLDKKYYTPDETESNFRGVPNRGQRFLAGINKRF